MRLQLVGLVHDGAVGRFHLLHQIVGLGCQRFHLLYQHTDGAAPVAYVGELDAMDVVCDSLYRFVVEYSTYR